MVNIKDVDEEKRPLLERKILEIKEIIVQQKCILKFGKVCQQSSPVEYGSEPNVTNMPAGFIRSDFKSEWIQLWGE